MTLSEQTQIDDVSTNDRGHVNVRWRTDVMRGDEVIGFTYHRNLYLPEDEVKDPSPLHKLDARTKRLISEARKGVPKG